MRARPRTEFRQRDARNGHSDNHREKREQNRLTQKLLNQLTATRANHLPHPHLARAIHRTRRSQIDKIDRRNRQNQHRNRRKKIKRLNIATRSQIVILNPIQMQPLKRLQTKRKNAAHIRAHIPFNNTRHFCFKFTRIYPIAQTHKSLNPRLLHQPPPLRPIKNSLHCPPIGKMQQIKLNGRKPRRRLQNSGNRIIAAVIPLANSNNLAYGIGLAEQPLSR